MPERIRISTTLIALGIALACLSAPALAAPGNSQASAVAAAKAKPKPPKPAKPAKPGKPVLVPEIGAEGAAAAILLTIGGIAVMTGRRRQFPAP